MPNKEIEMSIVDEIVPHRCSGCAYGLAAHMPGEGRCQCSCHLLKIASAVEKVTGVPLSEFQGARDHLGSRKHFAERQACAVLCVNAGWSLSTTARWLGYADHTTVRLATQTWREMPKVARIVNGAAALLANEVSFDSLKALRASLLKNFGEGL